MAKLKDLVKASGGTGADYWNIPVSLLQPNPQNFRLDSPALREHIAGIAQSIMDTGFNRKRILTIRQDGDTLVVVDGNCRLAAVKIAIAQGSEILTLPCVSEGPNVTEAERTVDMLVANQGLAHSPVEYAAAIKKLLSYGWTDADVARRLGKSRQWVSNTLETAALPPEAQTLIAAGVASATQMRKVVKAEGAAGVARVRQVAEETGRKRVTERHLAAPAVATVAAAALPAPVATPEADDATQDALVTLRQAVRGFLAAWDGKAGDMQGAVDALRSAVS